VAQGSLDELRAGVWRAGQAGTVADVAQTGVEKRSLEQIFLEIVGTDRDGNRGATAPEQELSWLS